VTRWNRLAWWVALVGGLGGLVAPAVATQWQSLRGGVVGSSGTTREAPCLPGRPVPVLPSPHISIGAAAGVHYNSLPPTSGPHFAFAPALGVYTDPLPDGLTVHALEHGHVAAQYAADTPAATVTALVTIAKRYPSDVVLAPYPKLAHGIALTAWGRIEVLDRFDAGRIDTFVVALRGRYNHAWTRADPC
jgi:hypothetical protein